MWKGTRKALFIEGIDAVGKNELVRSITKYLLLAFPERQVILMNFPQFWFFGHDIRLMLRGANRELFAQLPGLENLRTRAAMYAIDRNIATMVAEEYLGRYPKACVVSDRGPLSSCVTTGYLIAQGVIDATLIENGIPKKVFQEMDNGMFTRFQGTSLLCKVEGNFDETGLGARKSLDEYEMPEPQYWSQKVYESMHLPEIITKQQGEWKDRYLGAKEALGVFGSEPIPDVNKEVFNTVEDILLLAHKERRLLLIGPKQLLEFFRVDSRLLTPSLVALLETWEQLSLGQYDATRDRKEVLDEVETDIALRMKELLPQFSFGHISHDNPGRLAIQSIVNNVPMVSEILAKTSGEKMVTFLSNLAAVCQIRL